MTRNEGHGTERTTLSNRGARAASSVTRPDHEAFYAASQNHYDAADNPDGAIPLNVSESALAWPALGDKIQSIMAEQPIPDWVPKYTDYNGHPEVRQAVASFMTRHLTGCTIDPDRLVLTAGAMSALDISAHALGESGDVVVIPSPSYPVYTHDFGLRAELVRYDLVTHHDIDAIADGPALTTAHLDGALADIERDGQRFRLLVLTTPDNPTGDMFDRRTLEAVADWCIAHGIHLIVNEIYALSLIDTDHPELVDDYRIRPDFVSFARVMETRQSDYLHYCYAFSKDFGVSGFRFGLIYSQNEEFIRSFGLLNTFSMVSNISQWVMQQVVEDDEFVTSFIADNKTQLTAAYLDVVRMLRRWGVPYVPSRGSLFIWADLSEFLMADTAEAAHDLWWDIYESTGVLLTPGEGFGHTKHGMFRIVYPSLDRATVRVALTRLERFIVERRGD
jgi:aspartate/methionine/tyrosine aminotransferase